MERESNSMQAMCRSGCGFYGNPSTDGLCSLCYKEALKKKQQPPNPPPSVPSGNTSSPYQGSGGVTATTTTTSYSPSTGPTPAVDTALPTIPVITAADLIKENTEPEGAAGGSNESSISSGDAEQSVDEKEADKEAKKKKNRCAMCRKKVGLTGFECRCGGLYCAVHRYSDKHECTFDYREMGAQEIRRNNPVVIGEKIQKI